MPRLLFLECVPKSEGLSEALLLKDSFNILKRSVDGRMSRRIRPSFRRARNKDDFKKFIQAKVNYLHVSSHGQRDDDGSRLSLPRGEIDARDILNRKGRPRFRIMADVLFVSACEAWGADLREAFLKAGKEGMVYIAPKNVLDFHESFIVSLLFYKRCVIDGKTPQSSLKYAYRLKDIKANYWYEIA